MNAELEREPRAGLGGLIGNTPLLKLNRLATSEMADVLAKAEFMNPGGSVKDRIAWAMVEDAERRGLIHPESVIIEPTSGNTGIGLALVCAARQYRCVIVMPDSMSLERIYMLRAYGAEVVLTPGAEGMQGAIRKAEEISQKTSGSFMPQQFNNPANPEVHRRTTAREILKDTGGIIDAFVAGVGTGGTITGVGEVLKEFDKNIRVIAVEPESSAVLSGRRPTGAHRIQGIGPGFIPPILNRAVIDEVMTVTDREAFETAQSLARLEGYLCGISSGAALHAALIVAKRLGPGKKVLTVFPDRGERYFTTAQYFEF